MTQKHSGNGATLQVRIAGHDRTDGIVDQGSDAPRTTENAYFASSQ